MRRIWLTTKRMEKGLTQTQLAELCGVSNQTISNIERGLRRPSLELAYKIAKILDFDMNLFFEDRNSA